MDCELPYQTLLAVSPILNKSSWMSVRGFWNNDPKSQNIPTSGNSKFPVLGVDLEDGAQDPQVESLGIRMTSRGRPPVSDLIQRHFTARIATPGHVWHQQGLFATATRIGEELTAGTWPLTVAKGTRQKRTTREGWHDHGYPVAGDA